MTTRLFCIIDQNGQAVYKTPYNELRKAEAEARNLAASSPTRDEFSIFELVPVKCLRRSEDITEMPLTSADLDRPGPTIP